MPLLEKLIPETIRGPIRGLLLRHSLSTAQMGQDLWVYGEAFNQQRGGYFVDIGAHDGMWLSNSYLLERRYGWKGICIEANPLTFAALARSRRATCLNVCLDRSEGEVDFVLGAVTGGIVGADVDNQSAAGDSRQVVRLRTKSLVSVLQEQGAPKVIDYLSIDVEGAEERVISGPEVFDYTFRCLTVERPSVALRELFARHGYLIIKELPGLDVFYLHESFLPAYQRNCLDFYRKTQVAWQWR